MTSRFRRTLLATTALVPLGITNAIANPLGANVVGGAATVQGQGTSAVTVTQATDRAIINWNSFNVGTNEATRFVQPNASSVTLNRVTGNLGPSSLDGTLTANGRIFLVNPDGILFGANAKVNTRGFLATTNDIRNADFMAGKYQFGIPGRSDASIVNLGTITAQNGGFAALVAPGVRNSGIISARLGTVGLAAANSFSLDFYGDRLITVGVADSIAAKVMDVATGQPLNALVKNEGKLKANGGRVELTAVAARQVVDAVINNRGVIEANSIGRRNGMIVLGGATSTSKPAGAPTQTIKVSGTLSVAGKRKDTKGGAVIIAGENIELTAARIDASGEAGGGKVLIGGGKGNAAVGAKAIAALEPFSISTTSNVTVDAATTIDASAKNAGDGGKVIVWADQATTFYGMISARGGQQSGNGGFVETSGHQSLTFDGKVDPSAPHGAKGTLLLDPLNVTIQTGTGPGVVTVASIQAALANGDVVVNTGSTGNEAGNITVASNVNWATSNALTLSAYQNVFVNAAITNTGGAAVNLRADNTGTGVGTVSFGPSGNVSTAGNVSIFYNPSVNQAGSVVNTTSYVNPIENYSGNVTGGGMLTAYMLVNSVYDLQNVQNDMSGNYALGRNIDASATANWNGGAGFRPIGYSSLSTSISVVSGFSPISGVNAAPSRFFGTFDGLGHTISGLVVNDTAVFNSGLFSWIEAQGVVRNTTLSNISVTGGNGYQNIGTLAGVSFGTIADVYTTGSVNVGNSSIFIGGLVGYHRAGTISNSHTAVDVIAGNNSGTVGGLVGGQGFAISGGGTISGSSATGTVQAGDGANAIGGLVGSNDSAVIQNSYATGNVIAGNNAYAIGGLAGGNNGYWGGDLITRSYATGNVSAGNNTQYVGGFIGANIWYATVNNSYARGNVTGTSGVGGLVGWNGYTDINQPIPATIATSYATGLVIGSTRVGGLVGFNNNGTITNSYWDNQTTGMSVGLGGNNGGTSSIPGLTTAQLKSGLPSGFDPAVWDSATTNNNGYPYLLRQSQQVSNSITLTAPPPITAPVVIQPIQSVNPIVISLKPPQSARPLLLPGQAAFPTQQIELFDNKSYSEKGEGSLPFLKLPTQSISSFSTITAAILNGIPENREDQIKLALPYAMMAAEAYEVAAPSGGGVDHLTQQAGFTRLTGPQNSFSTFSMQGIEAKLSGFDAAVFINPTTKQVVVAFVGSQPGFPWNIVNPLRYLGTWRTNVEALSMAQPPLEYKLAKEFVEKIIGQNDGFSVSLTGHSLGGALASYASGQLNLPSVTFNAARNKFSDKNNGKNQLNVITSGDLVGDVNAFPIGGKLNGLNLYLQPSAFVSNDTHAIYGSLYQLQEALRVRR